MTSLEQGFTDRNGLQVHQFSMEMANLGFARMTDRLLGMLESQTWLEFVDGLGTYRFLPGEFDYFLTQQGVTREHVMNGVRDIQAKATLEAAMDERRTGEEGYRRRLAEARLANPTRPGRPIEPFGLTESEAKALVDATPAQCPGNRPALGGAIRRYTNTGGRTTVKPYRESSTPRWMQLRNAAERLSDEDLAELLDALKAERRRRNRIVKD